MHNHIQFIFVIQALILISSCGELSSERPTRPTLEGYKQNEQRKKEIDENLKKLDEIFKKVKKDPPKTEGVTDGPVEYAQPFLLQLMLNSKMKTSPLQDLPYSIQVKQIPGLIAPNKRAPLLEKWPFTEIKYSNDRFQDLLDADFMKWDVQLKVLEQIGCSYAPDLKLIPDPGVGRPESIKLCGHNEINTQNIRMWSPILFLDNATVDIFIDNPKLDPDSIKTTRLYLVGHNRIRIKYTNLSAVSPEMSERLRQIFTFSIVSCHGSGSLTIEAYGSDYDLSKAF